MKRLLWLSFLVTAVLNILTFNIAAAAANTPSETAIEIDIDIFPNEYLFDVSNMKPGDWAPRIIEIKNNGLKDFEYAIEIESESRDEKLLDELVLEVKDSEKLLFNGKVLNFYSGSRYLEAKDSEELQFTLVFPEHLGNDYQGLEAAFKLTFIAEGEDSQTDREEIAGTIGGGDNSGANFFTLPKTSTNIFNILLIGFLFLAGGTTILVLRWKDKRPE